VLGLCFFVSVNTYSMRKCSTLYPQVSAAAFLAQGNMLCVADCGDRLLFISLSIYLSLYLDINITVDVYIDIDREREM